MTLEEAIKEIENSNPEFGSFRQAVRLGLEALKLIQQRSPNRKLLGTKLLPGETEE